IWDWIRDGSNVRASHSGARPRICHDGAEPRIESVDRGGGRSGAFGRSDRGEHDFASDWRADGDEFAEWVGRKMVEHKEEVAAAGEEENARLQAPLAERK